MGGCSRAQRARWGPVAREHGKAGEHRTFSGEQHRILTIPSTSARAMAHAATKSPPRPLPMTRTEVLTCYRRLRQISKEAPGCPGHHRPGWIELSGRGTSPGRKARRWILKEHEMTLVEDLASIPAQTGPFWAARPLCPGRRSQLPGYDEAIVFEAMGYARFSSACRAEASKTAGPSILRDLQGAAGRSG